MPSIWDALAGVGIGLGTAGTAIAQDREKAKERALVERKIAEQERHNQAVEGAQQTDVGALFKAIGLEPPAGVTLGRMPNTAANAAIAAAQKRADVNAARMDREGIANVLRESAGTPPTPADVAPDVPVESGRDALYRILMPGKSPLPMGEVRARLAPYGKEGRETFKEMYPQDKYASSPQGIFHTGTGAVTSPNAPAQEPPAREGYQRVYRQDAQGRPTYEDRPINDRNDFDRAAINITQGRIQRYEDLTPKERIAADAWVNSRPWRNPEQRRLDAPLSPGDAGSLGVPYGTTGRAAAAQGPMPLTAAQRTKMDAQNAVLAMIDNMEQGLAGFAHPTGPVDRFLKTPGRVMDVYGQADPALTARHRQLEGTLALIVRSLGEVGTLTDKDIERARALQPTLAPIPDTEAVIHEKLNGLRALVQEVAGRTGNRPDAVRLGGPAGVGNTTATPQTQPAQGRIPVTAPDGTPGTWDASRGPIPPGYKRR